MLYVSDSKIDEFIREDVPYIDLTTWVLGFGESAGKIAYFTREDCVLCGTEEVIRVMHKLNIQVDEFLPSGSLLNKDEVFFKASGKAQDLHMAWKVCQNIFDHCSGIATKSKFLVDKAKAVNERVSVVGTRKGFPGTKELATKALMMGGALPHRLGLSESILVFKQHLNFIGGMESFVNQIADIKKFACEKKVVIEADNVEDCLKLAKSGIDGLQIDKFTPAQLQGLIPQLREINPHVVLLAAGGINESNIQEYAQTGVDALVTTSIYSAKPIDIGVRITP